MAFSFSLNGIRSDSKYINITNVKRPILPPIAPRTISIPNRNGVLYYKSKYEPVTIQVEITISSTTMELHRDYIREIANFIKPDNGLQQLIFDDEPEIYYWAILSTDTDLEQIKRLSRGTLKFLIPDSFGYSVNSQTIFYSKTSMTFTRATDSYLDGVLYASTLPRYSGSKYGSGLVIEKGTTNLFTANQSSIETDTTGFTAVGSSISKNSFFSIHGKSSLKIVTDRLATNEGVEIGNTSIGGAFDTTFSCYLKGTGTIILRIYQLDGGGSVLRYTDSANITLSQTATRRSVSVLTGSDCVNSKCAILTSSQQTAIFYTDCLQLEKKSYKSSWQLGGVVRNDEDVYIPATSLFNGKEGTIELLYRQLGNVENSAAIVERGAYSSPISIDRIVLLHSPNLTNGLRRFTFKICRGASVETLDINLDMDEASVEGNYYYICCRWYLPGNIKLDIYDFTNNKTYSANSNTTIPDLAFSGYNNLVIGTNSEADNFQNMLLDDIRISNIERTNTEISESISTIKTNPLNLDSITTYKANLDSTLTNTNLSRVGTAPSKIISTAVFSTTATEFKILKSSGEYVRVVKNFVAGDILIINFDTKAITVNGTNAKSYLDINSIFFYLTEGDNILTITPDGVADVSITYIPRWL